LTGWFVSHHKRRELPIDDHSESCIYHNRDQERGNDAKDEQTPNLIWLWAEVADEIESATQRCEHASGMSNEFLAEESQQHSLDVG
jgi:hypothetical protein